MNPFFMLPLLGVMIFVAACSNSDLEVVGEELRPVPGGFILGCTILNSSVEPSIVGVTGALIQKRSTVKVRFATGDVGPGDMESFSLEFGQIPHDDFKCRAQQIYIRR